MNSIAPAKKLNFFVRCWMGQARLWQAYWLVGVLGQFVVLLLCWAITYPFWRGPQDNWWSDGIFLLVFLTYLVFASVSIWRCAPNANNPVWGAIARALLVMSWLYGLFSIWKAVSGN